MTGDILHENFGFVLLPENCSLILRVFDIDPSGVEDATGFVLGDFLEATSVTVGFGVLLIAGAEDLSQLDFGGVRERDIGTTLEIMEPEMIEKCVKKYYLRVSFKYFHRSSVLSPRLCMFPTGIKAFRGPFLVTTLSASGFFFSLYFPVTPIFDTLPLADSLVMEDCFSWVSRIEERRKR